MRASGKWLLYLFFLFPGNLLACPLCHTTTADEVRAGLLATAADPKVSLAVVLPFLSIGILLMLLNQGYFNRD